MIFSIPKLSHLCHACLLSVNNEGFACRFG
nr:MAG TPA: hypothetical protein [Caudoviricetes sp.]